MYEDSQSKQTVEKEATWKVKCLHENYLDLWEERDAFFRAEAKAQIWILLFRGKLSNFFLSF